MTRMTTIDRIPLLKADSPSIDRILLVDDDLGILHLLHAVLKQQGHQLLVAQKGEDALKIAATASPALIVLDITMPGMSGFEICQRLKENEATSDIPVIFLSGRQEIQDKVRGFELGAVDFITKPFEFQEVIARVRTQLELKRTRDELERLHQKTEALLLNMLPRSVAVRLRDGDRQVVERFDDVTILFCDLVGFTPMAARMEPDQLVALLNDVFSEIDCLAGKYGLEKIKTIGDTYMAAAGVPDPMLNHAGAVADFALELRARLSKVEHQWERPIRIRIGIHSGPVVAGIIGSKKFAYDLWGDTVNTASHLESSGSSSQIHVSAATRNLLTDSYQFEPCGQVEIKGKGKMETYSLIRKLGQCATSADHDLASLAA